MTTSDIASQRHDRDPADSRRIERLQAAREVENLMNRYEILLASGYLEKTTEMFALRTPGVRAEMVWGAYEGPDSIRRLYVDVHGLMLGDQEHGVIPGALYLQANTTSVIEVAGDGETARGYWICPGIGTKMVDERRKAHWGWCRRVADFIQEDGRWKIWHYAVIGIFNTPYDEAWTDLEVPDASLDMSWLPPELQADRPPTWSWVYTPEAKLEGLPLPPEPYERFSQARSY